MMLAECERLWMVLPKTAMSTSLEGDSDMEDLFGLSDFEDEGDGVELIQVVCCSKISIAHKFDEFYHCRSMKTMTRLETRSRRLTRTLELTLSCSLWPPFRQWVWLRRLVGVSTHRLTLTHEELTRT
jgi:hypothetical protein